MFYLARIFSILVSFFIFSGLVFAQTEPPQKGGTLPEFTLPVPADPNHQKYLGLSGNEPFFISKIKASLIIIEIFSMYCPHCQREAPSVNQFFKRVEAKKLSDTIKLIGIGVGNTDFEVAFYKKNYNVPFPLFSDSDFAIHKKLSEIRTPYFIVIKINKDGSHKIIYSKPGMIGEPDQFLKMILDESGIK